MSCWNSRAPIVCHIGTIIEKDLLLSGADTEYTGLHPFWSKILSMNETEQRLLGLLHQLGSTDQASLLAFAEFLCSRHPAVAASSPPPQATPEPEPVERPPVESVVAGLKRLARTYPMLDKSEMLSATSDLVATHIMKGTEPATVIDQLEGIFREHYEQLRSAAGE
jgi:hypothetical protein